MQPTNENTTPNCNSQAWCRSLDSDSIQKNLLGSHGLQHLAACLGTLATFLGASRHLFVVRDLFARRGAFIATLGAALGLVNPVAFAN